jgi:dynein heavy chain, axonemal
MALEDCLATGKPLMIENIEEDLDPVLDPILEKRVIKKGRCYIMPLADKEVDFDPNFKLFCTTRLPNPHYTPELSAKVTLIDFTVTMIGLEDQLLGKLIGKEKGELEAQRQALIEEVQNYKKKIKQLEDDLLDRLSNSQVPLHTTIKSGGLACGLLILSASMVSRIERAFCNETNL